MHPRHDAEGQRKQGTPSAQPGAYERNAPANDRMPAHGTSTNSFRGKTGGDKETDTRKRTSRPKPCLQNQTDCRVSHACPSSIMRILALKLRTRVFQICLTQKFFQAFSRSVKQLPLPISLSTVNVPPCASTKSREMESPSPLPCTLVPGTRK